MRTCVRMGYFVCINTHARKDIHFVSFRPHEAPDLNFDQNKIVFSF